MWHYIVAGIFYTLVMFLTFSDSTRKSHWFFIVSILLNTCGSVIWFMLVKSLDDKEKILINSIYWDFMILVIGYCIPLMIFKFSFNYFQMVGLIFIIFGFILLKGFHSH